MAMFESLSKRLEGVFTNLSGKGKLTEADVDEAMREVRLALLEADVSLRLVRQFVERVKARAVGAEVLGSFSPAQQVLSIVNDELIEMLGGNDPCPVRFRAAVSGVAAGRTADMTTPMATTT